MKLFLAMLLPVVFSATVYAEGFPGGFITVKEDQIVWKTAENGVKQATLYGDPSKPGLYVVRNIFPSGIWSAPHFHDQDRMITVMKGTWHVGMSTEWGSEGGDDDKDQKECGKGDKNINNPHHECVDPSAEIAGCDPDQGAESDGDQDNKKADGE